MTPLLSSICIPRMEMATTKEYILNTLSSLHIGKIDKITEIPLRNDPAYKRIIIKIHWNEKNETVINIKERLQQPTGTIKIVHNMPWYWKVVSTHPQI